MQVLGLDGCLKQSATARAPLFSWFRPAVWVHTHFPAGQAESVFSAFMWREKRKKACLMVFERHTPPQISSCTKNKSTTKSQRITKMVIFFFFFWVSTKRHSIHGNLSHCDFYLIFFLLPWSFSLNGKFFLKKWHLFFNLTLPVCGVSTGIYVIIRKRP